MYFYRKCNYSITESPTEVKLFCSKNLNNVILFVRAKTESDLRVLTKHLNMK